MRVTDNMTYNQVHHNMQRSRSNMSRLHDQAATQKRVTKPSDDPVAASRVLTARMELRGSKQFEKNLAGVEHFLRVTDDALNELTEVLVRAKELAIGQANDASASKDTMMITSAEVQQLYDQMIKIGNYSFGNRYLFSGYKTKQAPFDLAGNYHGDKGEMLVHVDKDSFISMNVPGSKVFLGQELGRDGVAHVTTRQPRSIEQLTLEQIERGDFKFDEYRTPKIDRAIELRSPSSVEGDPTKPAEWTAPDGINIFQVVKNFDISLRSGDKYGVQDAIADLDRSLEQVILARASVGSRSRVIEHSMETLQKEKFASQAAISDYEDADIFKVVSDINKTESTLKATLQTTSKLIEPTLMDFIR